MMGKPCLNGPRIPASLIAQKLRAGDTPEEILAAYPQLSSENIAAVVQNWKAFE